MPKSIVLKPFDTPQRRFAVGDEVADHEIDGPMSAAQWRERGFLGPKPAPAALDDDPA